MDPFGPRVHVAPNYIRASAEIWLGERRAQGGGGFYLAQPAELVMALHDPLTVAPKPSLVVDDDMGRALLDALARHYGQVGDVVTLRADYNRERDRVDKMIDHLLKASTYRIGMEERR